MLTRDEALSQMNEIVKAFCGELGISMPERSFDSHSLWGGFCYTRSEYNGHEIDFSPFFRHTGQTGFRWGDEVGFRNSLMIRYKLEEVEHPECEYCEHDLEIERGVSNINDAVSFAQEIKKGTWG